MEFRKSNPGNRRKLKFTCSRRFVFLERLMDALEVGDEPGCLTPASLVIRRAEQG